MKILLINPCPSVWHAPKVPPLGLGYIAAVLEREGHAVRIWDAVVEPQKPSLSGYDLVGATAVTPQIREAWKLLAEAKAHGACTVLGGPHPTCMPEESLNQPQVDFVVRQEGEAAIVDLVRAIEQGGRLQGVSGVSYKRDGDKVIINEPDRQPIQELDDLPFPAHHLFPRATLYTNPQPLLSRRAPALAMFTSRGCPYGCTFCYKGTFGYGFRARSPENVVEEWEHLLHTYHVQEIAIQDDIFNFNIARAIAICRLIVELKLQVPWCTPNGIRADRVSEELFRGMRESGCERVAFGVETGNQGILALLKKHETLEQIQNGFELAQRSGLKTMGFFMFGNLGETRATMEDTIQFAISLRPTYAQFTMATPYPGTKLYEVVRRDGQMLVDDWEQYGHYTTRSFFRMGAITPELLQHEMQRAYRKFYLRLPFVAHFVLERSTWENLGNVLRGAWHLLARA